MRFTYSPTNQLLASPQSLLFSYGGFLDKMSIYIYMSIIEMKSLVHKYC